MVTCHCMELILSVLCVCVVNASEIHAKTSIHNMYINNTKIILILFLLLCSTNCSWKHFCAILACSLLPYVMQLSHGPCKIAIILKKKKTKPTTKVLFPFRFTIMCPHKSIYFAVTPHDYYHHYYDALFDCYYCVPVWSSIQHPQPPASANMFVRRLCVALCLCVCVCVSIMDRRGGGINSTRIWKMNQRDHFDRMVFDKAMSKWRW